MVNMEKYYKVFNHLFLMYHVQFELTNTLQTFSPVKQGLKQGFGLSLALFSIYIHDLAAEINTLHCGINFDNNEVNMLLYADDVVLIYDSADDLQNMLNTLGGWWRLAVNESKTKIVHFRNKNRLWSNFMIQCGEKVIAFQQKYKYLGFYLDL